MQRTLVAATASYSLVIAAFVTALVGTVTACSSSNPSSFGSVEAPDSAASWSPACPADPPKEGAACPSTWVNLQCEYGDAWWSVSCDKVLACNNGVWSTVSLDGTGCQPAPGPNSSLCPSSQPTGTEATCPQAQLECWYGGALCTCYAPNADAGATGGWQCLPGPGCPSSRTRLGSRCSGTPTCVYRACGYEQQCASGIWQGSVVGCQ